MTLLTYSPHVWPGNTGETRVLRPEVPEHVLTSDNVSNPSSEELAKRWIRIAMFHAICRPIQDPVGFIASIAGVDGAWGFGETCNDALVELESVLAEWLDLKLTNRDSDIPKMEHIDLAYAMA